MKECKRKATRLYGPYGLQHGWTFLERYQCRQYGECYLYWYREAGVSHVASVFLRGARTPDSFRSILGSVNRNHHVSIQEAARLAIERGLS